MITDNYGEQTMYLIGLFDWLPGCPMFYILIKNILLICQVENCKYRSTLGTHSLSLSWNSCCNTAVANPGI